MKRVLLIATIPALLSVPACKRDEKPPLSPPFVPSVQALEPGGLPAGHPPIGHGPSGAPAMPQGNAPSGAAPGAPSGQTLAWDLPKGWTEEHASGMRLATFKPPVPGKVDVSVIVLPGTGGGELGNVNRWRGQIGLGPIDEAAREHMRQEVKSKVGAMSVYDFTGEGAGTKQRMLAALLTANGQTGLGKRVGARKPVADSRAGFVKLLESFHPTSGS